MLNGLKQKAIVQPGGVVEIRSSELPAGATVEVIVLLESLSDQSQRSLTSFIGTAKGIFATPESADQFIRQERDSWES
ncbi:MAG TPA: hypothetical protein DDW76_34160 [Cyanobacteria bacterium UBA11369]|nr:hypothetical protein [Cyanobacteria bacterium UBA11371]HBE20167.1 hypothetical protein [Cyanobacteria bacterium UBA11367]HBE34406.1 hypothetical protein [Cyanobacteria bacterium UBA11368]HBE53659.1 hypothetical protein [Cyanobacteria bacterium UBA11369]